MEGIILAAQHGLGIGFASQVVTHQFAYNGQVGYAQVRLPGLSGEPGFDLTREIFLGRLAGPGIEKSPSLERLWDFLRFYLEQPGLL